MASPACAAPPCRVRLTRADPRYPTQLAAVPHAPDPLHVLGDPAALSLPQLAIVGSRAASPAGCETAFRFAAELAARGLAITSGLATGIDAAAHRGALAAGGVTIAVCGTGLDRSYPAEHAALAGEIARRGALVSEFEDGTPPLARGVLVVEAAARSGSLITARHAGEQGREVLAVPGSIHNALARGCHRLIRDGAALVETPSDVLAVLGLPEIAAAGISGADAAAGAEFPCTRLDSGAEMLLNALGFEPADLDQLVERTGLAAREAASKLQMLELEGRVESLAGGRFSRTITGRAR